MGQKVNPRGLRLGINKTWDSRWYAEGDRYGKQLHEDLKIRAYTMKKLSQAGVSRVVIERSSKICHVIIYTARPGVVVGKKGQDIESLRRDLRRFSKSDIKVSIMEVRRPELDAQLVADGVARQLEQRVSFRRALKRAVQSSMRLGALGIRINCSGRLGGVDIARTEWYREGRVPLHTLRADVDYALSEALTTYGILGIKVWIYTGDILEHDSMASEKKLYGESVPKN